MRFLLIGLVFFSTAFRSNARIGERYTDFVARVGEATKSAQNSDEKRWHSVDGHPVLVTVIRGIVREESFSNVAENEIDSLLAHQGFHFVRQLKDDGSHTWKTAEGHEASLWRGRFRALVITHNSSYGFAR
jgi:hypothetical protein